jgi:hypothetical protein
VLRVHFKKVRVVQGCVCNSVLLNIPPGEAGRGRGGGRRPTFRRPKGTVVVWQIKDS